jgi:hypothetical protein
LDISVKRLSRPEFDILSESGLFIECVMRINASYISTNTGRFCKKSGKFYVIRLGDLFQKSREISPLFLKY